MIVDSDALVLGCVSCGPAPSLIGGAYPKKI